MNIQNRSERIINTNDPKTGLLDCDSTVIDKNPNGKVPSTGE